MYKEPLNFFCKKCNKPYDLDYSLVIDGTLSMLEIIQRAQGLINCPICQEEEYAFGNKN